MDIICDFTIPCATDVDFYAPEFEETKRAIIQSVKERIGNRNANQRLTYRINCSKVQGTTFTQQAPQYSPEMSYREARRQAREERHRRAEENSICLYEDFTFMDDDDYCIDEEDEEVMGRFGMLNEEYSSSSQTPQMPARSLTPISPFEIPRTQVTRSPNGCTIFVRVYGFSKTNYNEIDFFLDQNGADLVEIGKVQSNNNGSATPFTTPADYMAAQTETQIIEKEITVIAEQLDRYQIIIDNNLSKLKNMPNETEFDEIKNTVRKTLDFATAQYNELEQQLNDKNDRLSGLKVEFLI